MEQYTSPTAWPVRRIGYGALVGCAALAFGVFAATESGLTNEWALSVGCALVLLGWLFREHGRIHAATRRSVGDLSRWATAFAAFCYGTLLVFVAASQYIRANDVADSMGSAFLILCCILTPFLLWHVSEVLAAYVAGQYLALVCSVSMGAAEVLTELWPVLAAQAFIATFALMALARRRRMIDVLLDQQQSLLVRGLSLEERAIACDRSRSEFLATACHDLRQPANALALFVEELAQAAPAATFDLVLGRVRAASQNLNAALDVLTEIAMIDAGRGVLRRETINVRRIVETVLSTYRLSADSKGLQLRLSPIGEKALGDPAILHSILANLVANAVKYTDRGWIHISAAVRGTQLDLVVEDTGRGVSEADQSRLYEEFFRGENVGPRDSGMGLGLALVHRLVTRADWQIELASSLGQGTRFTLTMPLALASNGASAAAIPARLVEQKNALDGCRILILEDDIFVASSMRRTMEQWGAMVHEAHSIEEMMRLLEDGFCMPDVVVVDHRLSDSGSGFDAVKLLRAHRATMRTPVLMVTGDLDAKVREIAEQVGVRLMHKPLSVTALNRALQALSKQASVEESPQETALSSRRSAERMHS